MIRYNFIWVWNRHSKGSVINVSWRSPSNWIDPVKPPHLKYWKKNIGMNLNVSEYLEKCSNSLIRELQILSKQDIMSVDKLGQLTYFDWSATLYSHVEEKLSVYGKIEICMLNTLALLILDKYQRDRCACECKQHAQRCRPNNDSSMENSKHLNCSSTPYE